ncbi:MAG: AAA family ATPase [Myxococcales bacterium]
MTAASFVDREEELGRLLTLVSHLEAGHPSWLAILGPRKIGKTSLILECARRTQSARVRIAAIDALEETPISLEFFRRYALRALDVLFAEEIGQSPEALARTPGAYRAAMAGAPGFRRLDEASRSLILELPDARISSALVRACLDLPERLATALKLPLVVAIDEFQELAALASKKGGIEPYPMMRSAWQRHQRSAYVISGSARTMIERLVTSRSSPFFQHFALMRLGPLPESAALRLLMENAPRGRPITQGLAAEIVRLLGTRPFYLQIVGEALARQEPPIDRSTLKSVVQDLLFSKTGRVSLYFENEFERLVGRSTFLASTLEALAEGPKRNADLARAIGATPGQTSGYLERLGDAVLRREDGLFELDDQTFALWLRWRRPGGSVVPMQVLGEEGERAIAEHLARCGFELVYQSRASRGAFDLLAIRGGEQLGVQVKRCPMPLRFSRAEWSRMQGDATRFGWRWVVAAVSPSGTVVLLDPVRARVGKAVVLHEQAAVENIVTWMDRG